MWRKPNKTNTFNLPLWYRILIRIFLSKEERNKIYTRVNDINTYSEKASVKEETPTIGAFLDLVKATRELTSKHTVTEPSLLVKRNTETKFTMRIGEQIYAKQVFTENLINLFIYDDLILYVESLRLESICINGTIIPTIFDTVFHINYNPKPHSDNEILVLKYQLDVATPDELIRNIVFNIVFYIKTCIMEITVTNSRYTDHTINSLSFVAEGESRQLKKPYQLSFERWM